MTRRRSVLLIALAAAGLSPALPAQSPLAILSPAAVAPGSGFTDLMLGGGPFRHGQWFVLRDTQTGLTAALPASPSSDSQHAVLRYRFGEAAHAWTVQRVDAHGMGGDAAWFGVGDADVDAARARIAPPPAASAAIGESDTELRPTATPSPVIPSTATAGFPTPAPSVDDDAPSSTPPVPPPVAEPVLHPAANRASPPVSTGAGNPGTGALPPPAPDRSIAALKQSIRRLAPSPAALEAGIDSIETASPPSSAAHDQSVRPEVTVSVIVSNRDVNRIACESPITDTFWSQERPVKITTKGGNVFVKVLASKLESRITPVTDPIDLHIVCGEAVYTMVMHPRETDSVTIRLLPPVARTVKALSREWNALPLEQRVQKFTLMVYRNESADGFERRPIDDTDARRQAQLVDASVTPPVHLFPDLSIRGLYDLYGNGTGLKATEYRIAAQHGRHFQEADFINPVFGDIVGITVDPLTVAPGETARLIVITRSVDREPR